MDCMEGMKNFPDGYFELAVVDPPYGVGAITYMPGERIHPTQKPVKLYQELLAHFAKPGDKILDTHVGSGSSLVACHDAGHEYVGFELDADYHAAALERLEAAKMQMTVDDAVMPTNRVEV